MEQRSNKDRVDLYNPIFICRRSSTLKRYRRKDITLTLPDGKTLSNVKWFAVWCDEFSVSKEAYRARDLRCRYDSTCTPQENRYSFLCRATFTLVKFVPSPRRIESNCLQLTPSHTTNYVHHLGKLRSIVSRERMFSNANELLEIRLRS